MPRSDDPSRDGSAASAEPAGSAPAAESAGAPAAADLPEPLPDETRPPAGRTEPGAPPPHRSSDRSAEVVRALLDPSWALNLPRSVARQAGRMIGLLSAADPTGPLDLGLLGRVLLHAALVGLVSGLAGALFFGALELVQHLSLERMVGYTPLRAAGELGHDALRVPGEFRWYMLLILPAIGGLASGLITRLAPETRGGGADAMIEAFHHRNGVIRKRVAWVKGLASIATLGTGGAGGREGPTMQIGGALGSLVANVLGVGARERRVLLLAGVAAGISAVFRTPLGAALLAVEILYRDGFESDALIPAVLASVVSYSVVISIYGETTLFAHAARYPFIPSHLPLYGALALMVAALAAAFVSTLGAVRRASARLPIPRWARPAAGGLALGLLATPLILLTGHRLGESGHGLGILGGGYGAVQIAISGSPLLPEGWAGVDILILLCLAKLVGAALTIGSGGSAGDFAPSLVLGGLFGGAFGRAAALLLNDPRIDPGAFALVGMGAFYGGIAHVPLSALVLVCEMAGSYDLLVPLMLAEGIAYVALRKRTLYPAQVPTLRESPVHRRELGLDVLTMIKVTDVMTKDRAFVRFEPATKASQMFALASDADRHQDVFPVLDAAGTLRGLVTSDALRVLATESEIQQWAVAADVMQRAVSVLPGDDLATATRRMLKYELRELPVTDGRGAILGFLDEADVARIYLEASVAQQAPPPPVTETSASELPAVAPSEYRYPTGETSLQSFATGPTWADSTLNEPSAQSGESAPAKDPSATDRTLLDLPPVSGAGRGRRR